MKETNEMLSAIAFKSALVLIVSLLFMSVPVKAYAANGNASTDSSEVYDGNYNSWKNGSGQSEINYVTQEFNGITYYIPIYRDESRAELLYSQYFLNDTGYVYDDKMESLLIHPAILYRTYFGNYWSYRSSTFTVYENYEKRFPGRFKDINIKGPFCPLILDTSDSSTVDPDIYAAYYYYISTGCIPPGFDRGKITLPDGWSIDDDGFPYEQTSDIVLISSGTVTDKRNSSFSYEKIISDYGDKKLCFYLNSTDDGEIYSVYSGLSLEQYVTDDYLSDRYELMSTSLDFRPYNLSASLLNYGDNFYILGNNVYSSGTHSGGGSHGGGHFGDDEIVVSHSIYSLLPTVSGYPVLIDGFLDVGIINKYISSVIRGGGENSLFFKWLISLNFGHSDVSFIPDGLSQFLDPDSLAVGDYVYNALFSESYVYPLKASSLKVYRPVFKTLLAASGWYESGYVQKKSDIFYIPEGYYYHSDTHLLDKNPLTNDEPVTDNNGNSNVGWGDVSFGGVVNKNTTNNNTTNNTTITSGEGITVIVTQENNNNQENKQTNENNQEVVVPDGSGDVSDAFPMDDLSDGLTWMSTLTGTLSNSDVSSASSDDNSSSGKIDSGAFTKLMGGIFDFLPAEYMTLLLVGLIGAILLRFFAR